MLAVLAVAAWQFGCSSYDSTLLVESSERPSAGSGLACAAGSFGVSCSANCPSGRADCDGNPANGCEVDLTTQVNCGTCGLHCSAPHARVSCVQGRCAIEECAPGFANCNGVLADGCEADLSSPEHCGRCGATCQLANAEQVCTAQGCQLLACQLGYADCDGDTRNGCETRLDSVATCGACGVRCEFAHAEAACIAGRCALAFCHAGYLDCDGLPQNGCELNLNDPSVCGCGVTCGDYDPCTNDFCQPDGSCLHEDNGSCSCPGVDSCVGGVCAPCGPSCGCNRECSAARCDSVCSVNATCTLGVRNAEAARQGCSGGSRCNLDCHSVTGLCAQDCGAGAHCDLDCYATGDCLQLCEDAQTCSLTCAGTGNCTLDCRGNARCIAYGCSGPNCELQCNGTLRDCDGGIAVCNRSCPD